MADITKTFRAMLKAKQASSDFNPGLNKRVKKEEKPSAGFLSGAKRILTEIVKLKSFLLESRTNYLSPVYLLSTSNKIMNDEQRLDYEQHVEKQIKRCRDELEELKSSIGRICFQGQRRSHFELVGAYLERDLIECTKIYSEQKCLRYKRESERKKIGRLDNDVHRVILNIDKSKNNHNPKKTDIPADTTAPATRTENSNTTITKNHFDQDNHTENGEDNQTPSTSLTDGELRQLQMENNQLYHDVAQRSEEIHAIATQVVEIAQLQNELFDNIFSQSDLIQNIDTTAVATNDDIAAAIIHIRDAIRNAAQMRRWVIFFLLVMIFSLLFLDWYNV